MEYEDEGQIGRGGMAVVYQVKRSATGERFAMKRPLPFDGCQERMEREIDVMRNVVHPHVMPVVDHGTDEHGEPWYVMPLAPGSLKSLWEDGKLGGDAEAVALRLLEEAAAGLGAMHDANYIHRDVKPANLVALKDPTRPDGLRWVIADCGLVRRPLGQTTNPLTGSASQLGTWGYMAPESLRAPHMVGEPADIYSFGRVLAWLLTGQDPYLTEPLFPPGRWRDVVRSFTQPDPDRRPQRMADAVRLAQGMLADLPTSSGGEFRRQIETLKGRLVPEDALWDVVEDSLEDAEFMFDDLVIVSAASARRLAVDRPQFAVRVASRLCEHLTESDWGRRSFDFANDHLGWVLSVLKGLDHAREYALLEDAAIPYASAVKHWNRFAHNDVLRAWMPGVHESTGAALAVAIRDADAIDYFRDVFGGSRFDSRTLDGLLRL